jgi:hypothetical protein
LRLLIKRRDLACSDALPAQSADRHGKFVGRFSDDYSIANLNPAGGLCTLTVYTDTATLNRLAGEAARFKKTCAPQPFVDPLLECAGF